MEKSWAAVASGGSAADSGRASSAEGPSEDPARRVRIALQPAPAAPAAAEVQEAEMAGISSPPLSAIPPSPQTSPLGTGQVIVRGMSPEGDVWFVPLLPF